MKIAPIPQRFLDRVRLQSIDDQGQPVKRVSLGDVQRVLDKIRQQPFAAVVVSPAKPAN